MEKIVTTWSFAGLNLLAFLLTHRLSYEITSLLNPEGLPSVVLLMLGISFRILTLIVLGVCLFISFFLPVLQLFLIRKEMTTQTVSLVFVGTLLAPTSILVVVTAIVHDLDGGELLFLAILATPIITALAFAILGFSQRLSLFWQHRLHEAAP